MGSEMCIRDSFKDIETAKKELTANSKLFKDKGYDSWVCTFLKKGITFI